MGRVLPFIFVTTGLVAVAVFQAHQGRTSGDTPPLALAEPIRAETLDTENLR